MHDHALNMQLHYTTRVPSCPSFLCVLMRIPMQAAGCIVRFLRAAPLPVCRWNVLSCKGELRADERLVNCSSIEQCYGHAEPGPRLFTPLSFNNFFVTALSIINRERPLFAESSQCFCFKLHAHTWVRADWLFDKLSTEH